MRTYDKPIILQKLTDHGEWELFLNLRAHVNKAGGGERHEYGARRAAQTLTFEVRYQRDLQAVFLNTQGFRIIYRGAVFYITDYDDYMEKHINVSLEGECTGERFENIS